MSIILAVTAALVLVLADLIATRKVQGKRTEALARKLFHPGHTWMRVTEDGDVLVGIDEFAQSLLGSINGIELPRLLRRVRQGSVAVTVRHGNRVAQFVSPVSGRVVEKNEMVVHNPSLVNTSPYGDGWLLRVHPKGLPAQMNNLMGGKSVHQWQELALSRLHQFFSGTPALLYQDGGVLSSDLADRCSDEEWARLTREFFLHDGTTISPETQS
jgi:glycine cleavage system H protein